MPAKVRLRETETVLPGTAAEQADDREARLALVTERLTALSVSRLCDPANPAPFTEFAPAVLGITLTPAQHALASVLFDGQAPPPEFADSLFGGLTSAPTVEQRITAVAVCGRGSGKTSVLEAGRALHLALTVPLTRLAKSEAALVAIVAPDQRASRHTLSFVKGYITNRPALASLLHYEDTLDVIRITRPDGRLVTIEARPATSGGKAVRGPSLAGVLLDEAAFFYGDGYEVSDEEIYRAARPRLEPGGQIVIASTPWAQSGLVWERFRENYGAPKRAVVARAPTLIMRPGPETEAMVRLEREADPDNAAREFDAEFLSSDAERFFPEPVIEKCLDESLRVDSDGHVLDVSPGERVRPGADFAFDADSSALVCFVERAAGFSVCELHEDRPTPGASLVPSEVVSKYAAAVRRVGGKLVVADAHYRRSIEEHLAKYELALVPAPPVPAESFLVVRQLMAAGRVKIPNHPRLLAQLRRVRSSHKPGGHVSIHQPRARDGGHGDIVSALVCALSGVSITSSQPVEGPKSWLEREVLAETERKKDRLKANDVVEKKKDARFSRMVMSRIPGARALLRSLRTHV